MISYKIPKILFIKDLFLKDISLNNNNRGEIITKIENMKYEKLPSIFTDIKYWPKKTNLVCWHCSLSFTDIPVFIPTIIEPVIFKNKNNEHSITVYGVFCCFGDAFEFVKNSNWSLTERIEACNKLKYLYKIFYNIKYEEKCNYPSIYSMIQYGGDLTINQYKKIINDHRNKIEINYFEKN